MGRVYFIQCTNQSGTDWFVAGVIRNMVGLTDDNYSFSPLSILQSQQSKSQKSHDNITRVYVFVCVSCYTFAPIRIFETLSSNRFYFAIKNNTKQFVSPRAWSKEERLRTLATFGRRQWPFAIDTAKGASSRVCTASDTLGARYKMRQGTRICTFVSWRP